MVKEYWVNVYKNNELGVNWSNYLDCELMASINRKVLYRIHVRMKDNGSQARGS